MQQYLRNFLPILALTFLSAAPAPPNATPPRDWKTHPAVVEISAGKEDIYAIGDIHGDYEKAADLLAKNKLLAGVPVTPEKVEWTGGKSVLVCTGDMIDKGPQSLAVLQLMRALQSSAESRGGTLIILLGNHEAEFLASDGADKKAADFQADLLAHGINPAAFALGRDAAGLGAWLRNRPIAAKVDNWFFCHAGNTFGMSLPQIEQAVESGVDKDGFATFFLAQPNSILEARMSGVPWWYLDANNKPTKSGSPDSPSRILHAYAAALGCDHIVVGHQPGKVTFTEKIERSSDTPFAYDGVLFLIDTGMSRGVADGPAVLLKIHAGKKNESAAILSAGGTQTPLWSNH